MRNMARAIRVAALGTAIFFAVTANRPAIAGKIIQWTDEKGVTHYTDREDTVPQRGVDTTEHTESSANRLGTFSPEAEKRKKDLESQTELTDAGYNLTAATKIAEAYEQINRGLTASAKELLSHARLAILSMSPGNPERFKRELDYNKAMETVANLEQAQDNARDAQRRIDEAKRSDYVQPKLGAGR